MNWFGPLHSGRSISCTSTFLYDKLTYLIEISYGGFPYLRLCDGKLVWKNIKNWIILTKNFNVLAQSMAAVYNITG